MRLSLVILISAALSVAAHGQVANDPEQVVSRIINTGFIEGHDQKVIGRLGDAAAVLVTKVLADRGLTSETVSNALVVIQGSFAGPSFIEPVGDRQPRTTLLVLRYLDLSTNDAELKKRIADASKYVRDRYAASVRVPKR